MLIKIVIMKKNNLSDKNGLAYNFQALIIKINEVYSYGAEIIRN